MTVTQDAAHSGESSLLTTGRTANWHGAAITPPFEKDVTYEVTAWARLVTGQPSATIALTVQRTPADGGDTVYERVAAATVTDSGWVELSGSYKFSVDSTLSLYAESSDPTGEFYLDDVVITSDSNPAQSGVRSDFESGSAQGWAPRASATVTVTDARAHGGTRSLLTTGRADFWDGPSLNVLGKMAKGSKYELEVWVRLGENVSSGNLGLSLERRTGDTPVYEQIVTPKPIPAGEWVQLKGTYLLAHDVDFLSVYVESDTGTFDFYLDDFALTYVEPKPIQTDIPSLKDVLPFTVGAAVYPAATLGEHGKLIRKHYGSITPGNALKWDATQPREGEFTFADGDLLVDYAAGHGLKFRGHTLVWHSQVPDWVFKDGDRDLQATPADKALLLKRLETHVRTVVGRYQGKIDTWDVANEVIDENQPDGLRRSKWFQITGLDYLRTAFRVARQADPKAKLFINDYNTEFPRKREALYKVVKRLKAEGVPIDGVGHQLHVNIEHPPAYQIEDTIQRFADLKVKQQVTELDVSIYTDFVQSYPSISPELLTQQGHRYKEIFDVFRRQKDRLDSVTIWGLADDATWLSSFPITRLNAPLPFDDELQAKPAYWGIVDPARLDPWTRTVTAPRGTPKVDGKSEPLWEVTPATILPREGAVSAAFSARWDAAKLYVLVHVADPTRDRDDAVSVTVAGKTYRIPRTGPAPAGVKAVAPAAPGGWVVEAALPVPGGAAGKKLPLEVAVTDKSSRTIKLAPGELALTEAVKIGKAGHGAPRIDGVEDPIWRRAPEELTTGTWIQGTSGATAKVRALWQGDTLYVLAKVTDPALDESSPNPWEQDSVEIFVDPENNKTKGYDDDDGQYRISFSGKETLGGTFDAAGIQGNLTGAAKVVPGGYVVEAAIRLPTVTLAKDKLVGFDVQVNDAAGGARTGAVTWNDASGQSYLNTRGWGVLQLTR